MSNPSQSGEIEKFGIIPARLDDVKKTYKTLKSSLAESLGAFNNYGKSLIKASRPLHFAFNHSDPSFICKLTLNLLTQQAQTSKLLNHSVSEALKDFSKDMDTYEEKLDQTRAKTFDKISESLRSLGVARAAYVKERGNYEKVCKEAEAAVAERKKPITDPILYYNLTHQRKLKAKVIEGLHNLTASEQQARDALETYSMRQQVLNVGLSESLRVFKETLRTVLESIFSNVKKHNQVVQGFLQKELNHYEKADLLTSAGTFSFPSDSDEQEFIQKVALESQDPQVKDPAQAKEPKEPKHKFLDIHYKLLEKPQSLSDQEVYEYAELAQKHYEASLQVFEERQKAIKGLKAYMLELALVCTATEKTFQKISKNSLSQVTGTTLSKQLGSNIDALYEGLAAFGSLFQQLAGYLNSKAPLLDGLTNDYRDYIKVFQAGFTKALKDSVGSRSAVATLVGQQDKLNKKVTDVNERDPDDERLPVMIEEQENVKKQLGELLAEMRRQTIDTASGINKAFDDYRIQEQMKFMDFQNIIKGHLEQEHKLAKGLMDALKTMETGLEANISAPVEEKAEKALKEDKLNGYLQYYEMNMQENQNNASAKQTLEFKKLYVPPENVLNDEEGADKVDVVEEEDEAAAAGKEQEKVDEGDKISAEKLRTRFGLKPNEKLVENFACGVEQRIIRQGRMYIYNTAVCFSTVKLLGDIAISIPFEDILRIEKKTMSLVFDTALSVITKNGEIKFLSFFYRDKAFNLLVSLVKENNSTFVSPEKVERKDSSAATPKVDSDGGSAEQAKNKRMQEVITERLKRAAAEAEAEAEASNSGSEAEEKEPGSGMRRASLDLSDGEGEKQDKDKQQEDKGEKKVKEAKEENKVKESEDNNKGKESKVVKETNTPTTVEPKSVAKPSTEQKEKEKESAKVEQPAEEAKKPVEAEVVEKKVEKKEPEGPSQEELDKKEKHKLMKVIEQKKVKLSTVVVSEDTCPQLMTQETFDCSALDLFMGAFSDRKVTYKGKSFDCFWTLAKTEGGDTDIKYNRWTPDPPFEGVYEDKDSLECLRKFAEGTGQTTRSLTYIHPVDGGPFVPKTCQVEEKHTGYWLSPTEFVMQMLVQTSKVPMSDCFFARNYFRVKELPGQKCEFTWKLGLEFVKSTMFKGKITSATQSENLSYAKKVFVPLLKENMAVWMKEKAQVLKKREAKKAAKREAEKEFDRQAKEQRQAAEAKQEEAKKAEEKAAVSEVKKEEGAGQGEVVVEKEGEKEEKKVEEQTEIKSGETDDSKSEVESAKDDEDLDKKVKVSSGLKDTIKESIKESIGEDLGKFIREAERSREESREEVKMLRNLVFALLAINSFLILYLVMRG